MNETSEKQSWWKRLSGGLKRTSASLGTAITDLVTKRKLDAATLDDLENELIRSDLGVGFASRITEALGGGATRRASRRTNCARCSPARSRR